mmetsp:Transcript_13878/g.35307  ORF Transcript_13878/g.35307 Transcript_13878/m.35307 type:complete len:213 (+) Transcript_13878:4643-5281(+)
MKEARINCAAPSLPPYSLPPNSFSLPSSPSSAASCSSRSSLSSRSSRSSAYNFHRNATGALDRLTTRTVFCECSEMYVCEQLTALVSNRTSTSTPPPLNRPKHVSPVSYSIRISRSTSPRSSGEKPNSNWMASSTPSSACKGVTEKGGGAVTVTRLARRPVLRTRTASLAEDLTGCMPKEITSGKSSSARGPRARMGITNFSRSVTQSKSQA